MRSFFKNSFGFKQIPPSVFVGVLIVLVIVFINPFKSSLSAISNVRGWSKNGTPKYKDTWNGARYYSADECAKSAISQGSIGYTWRNNDHSDVKKGRNTCVTFKDVVPKDLSDPMLDPDHHTTGCSMQNRQWPNCGTSAEVWHALAEVNRLNGEQFQLAAAERAANDLMVKAKDTYYYANRDYESAISNYNKNPTNNNLIKKNNAFQNMNIALSARDTAINNYAYTSQQRREAIGAYDAARISLYGV